MKKSSLVFFVFLLLSVVRGPWSVVHAPSPIYRIQIEDYIIHPITAEYIAKALERAEAENAQALLIVMDTPGGLLESTREIVKKIMNTPVPVIVYVSPAGSRAASAGVFITLAAHVAAMAPTTHIGAAHPVELGEGDRNPFKDLGEKEGPGTEEKGPRTTDHGPRTTDQE
ncbi:MAG: ATP-dependent Clp protease proteolytic subunit [Deltaproteobacteria bacterium]|nr:ATP-dependent Clp protease proteolytic subunit [Deltaproteobacteria bacterium]